ncbi:MAG: efflux RND transporter periplasmic adaptor subunit [Ignavibacteriales bacterium]|nr:efflux RND transporter periplasmic adaptor subunit [Ignavibacteriales bacterium]
MNSKSIKNISIAGFVIIVLGLLIVPRYCSKKEIGAAENGGRLRGGGAMIAVTVQIAKPSSFENTLQISGSVISNEEVDLRMETSGKITAINFKEGGKVNKGDLLVKVNDADLQAQLQKAEIRKKLAEEKEYRQRTLLEKKGISQETYDTVLNDLNSAKADIENLKALIAKTEIRAPFNGTIGLRYVSEGSYVSSATRIATLQNINPVKINFSVPQRYATAISIGNFISVKSSAGKMYQAKIYAIEPKIDPATRALQVRAICSNDRGELIPGSYLGITLALNDVKNAITIPTQALALDIGGESVFLYKNGTAVPQRVVSGLRTEDDVQIVSGLALGDTIITTGVMQLRPKAKVRIMNAENK